MKSYKSENQNLRSKAPATESDIVWENILKRSRTINNTGVRQILTMIALILVSFFLMTPATVLSLLNIVKSKDKLIHAFWQGLIAYIQPLLVVFINFTLIPELVDFSITLINLETKSEQEKVRIRRIYFFMILNTLLIPVTSTQTAVGIYKWAKD